MGGLGAISGLVAKAGLAEDVVWQRVQGLADAQRATLVRELVAVLGLVGTSISQAQLFPPLTAGDQPALEHMLSRLWEEVGRQHLTAVVAPAIEVIALAAAEQLTVPALGIAFAVADPVTLAAIRGHAGEQITLISRETRKAIRGLLERALASGLPVAQQAREIRALLGLTTRQAVSVARYREGLVAAGERSMRVQDLVTRRARTLLRQRAEMIARTETIHAVNMGAHERLRQAVRDGLVEPGRIRRFWLTATDERLCPLCAPVPTMNPQGVGIQTPFETPRGPSLYPPLHPQCRCTAITRI